MWTKQHAKFEILDNNFMPYDMHMSLCVLSEMDWAADALEHTLYSLHILYTKDITSIISALCDSLPLSLSLLVLLRVWFALDDIPSTRHQWASDIFWLKPQLKFIIFTDVTPKIKRILNSAIFRFSLCEISWGSCWRAVVLLCWALAFNIVHSQTIYVCDLQAL